MNQELPKVIVDQKGYLRIQFPDGQMLPEVDLKIQNQLSKNDKEPTQCVVTATFICEHNLKNKE